MRDNRSASRPLARLVWRIKTLSEAGTPPHTSVALQFCCRPPQMYRWIQAKSRRLADDLPVVPLLPSEAVWPTLPEAFWTRDDATASWRHVACAMETEVLEKQQLVHEKETHGGWQEPPQWLRVRALPPKHGYRKFFLISQLWKAAASRAKDLATLHTAQLLKARSDGPGAALIVQVLRREERCRQDLNSIAAAF